MCLWAGWKQGILIRENKAQKGCHHMIDRTIVCFHNPNEINGYLSNWYKSNFIYKGVFFTSAEQYMMASKAKLFGDYEIARKIMATNDVREIKRLGRQVRNFDETSWVNSREFIMVDGLTAKFSQDLSLATKLLSTGNCILAECAVRDKIWGIGLSMTDENRFDTSKWRGMNLLGKCLMTVRGNLCRFYV